MTEWIRTIDITPPYLVFGGDLTDKSYAKTGFGLVHWRPEQCIGQYCLPGSTVDFGLPETTPEEAAIRGARSLIVGVANVGGFFPESWITALMGATHAGLDIVSGLHTRLTELPGLKVAAAETGTRLTDVREPPTGLPVGTGRKRSGRRLLTVGTDCVSGKKYTALALEKEMRRRGLDATFRATGQTGIVIAGEGIPIDAVVSDFVSGAAEVLSPDNQPSHWDVIEGQGALFHPGYAGVSLGLLHGSQPDALVVCHDATREVLSGWPDYPIPDVPSCIESNLRAGRLTNPSVRCLGISVNTSGLPENRREGYLHDLAGTVGLPCVDPLIDGVGPIVDGLW